ncbi:MAG: hypothetical protein KZQ62_18550, partial [Candidatus Thiodiazotropha sp. (ex Lucinoma aequizonata)]|nr:hypothetical protein [Candidatus Thiodiazotropha sp. (ex Lucinoma aequizonata)]
EKFNIGLYGEKEKCNKKGTNKPGKSIVSYTIQVAGQVKISLATGEHVSWYHLFHAGRWDSLSREGNPSRSSLGL